MEFYAAKHSLFLAIKSNINFGIGWYGGEPLVLLNLELLVPSEDGCILNIFELQILRFIINIWSVKEDK